MAMYLLTQALSGPQYPHHLGAQAEGEVLAKGEEDSIQVKAMAMAKGREESHGAQRPPTRP